MVDEVASRATAMIIMAMTVAILVFLAIPTSLGMGVIWWLLKQRGVDQPTRLEAAPPLPPSRMFDAPPTEQWLNAYEYWLYRLEQWTGIDFSTTPNRLTTGALLVSVGPALLLALPLAFYDPANAGSWLLGFGLGGGGLGLWIGSKLSQPAGWFHVSPSAGSQTDLPEEGGVVLGEEEW